jgi:hypothetical protein
MNSEEARKIMEWRRSPLSFVKDMWGLTVQPLKEEYEEIASIARPMDHKAVWYGEFRKGSHVTWQQALVLRGLGEAANGKESRRISIKSGHGIGKSAMLSWIMLWFLTCHADSIIGCTAPSAEQMHDALWKELYLWIGRMPKGMRGMYDWQTGYLRMRESPKSWYARARTARKDKPEALAGLHSDSGLMLCVDEASGVDNAIYRTAEGALTAKNFYYILISNPTRLEGYFYDTHNVDSANWQLYEFNSEDSPIVDWGYVERIERLHGKDSDEYRVRVQGKFPSEDGMDVTGYVPLLNGDDIFVGKKREFAGNRRMGIDPSGEGDNKSVWCVRDIFRGYPVHREDMSNEKSIAGKTITLMEYYGVADSDIYIDNLGSGANVSKELALSGKNSNPVSFADKADDSERFANKRAEMYWRLREWIKSGGEVCDTETKEQILRIRYKINLGGKIQIMSKLEMRRRGIASPDDADALSLTFYDDDTQYLSGDGSGEDGGVRRGRGREEEFNPHAVI